MLHLHDPGYATVKSEELLNGRARSAGLAIRLATSMGGEGGVKLI